MERATKMVTVFLVVILSCSVEGAGRNIKEKVDHPQNFFGIYGGSFPNAPPFGGTFSFPATPGSSGSFPNPNPNPSSSFGSGSGSGPSNFCSFPGVRCAPLQPTFPGGAGGAGGSAASP